MKTVDIIARALHQQGVRFAYGIPGGEVLDLLEAFRRTGIRFVLTKHEMGAGMMADATFQLTGKPGVLVATLGPGLTNTLTGVAQAFLDRSAVVVVTGDVATSLRGRYTHQVLPQQALLAPLAKYSTTLGARNAFAEIMQAIAAAREPPPGPVHLNVPADVAGAEQPASPTSRATASRSRISHEDLKVLRAWLNAATKPIALVGIGVQLDSAERDLQRFVEAWRVPFITTYKAKGVIDESHPLCLGAAGLSLVVDRISLARLRESDLIVTIGFDPVELRSEWVDPWDRSKRVFSIDRVAKTHDVYRTTHEHIGSIAAALEALNKKAPKREPAHWPATEIDNYRSEVQRAIVAEPAQGMGPYQVTQALRDVFPRETIATVDTGAHRILINHVWRSYRPRSLLQSNGLGSMGYALPAAVAAKLVYPARPVLAMTGEAGLDMVIGEMALLAYHKLALTIVVYRDDILSLIRLKQQRMKLPPTGVKSGSPDYAALAKAYGGNGFVAQSVADLKKAARAALRSKRFSLIEARINPAEYRHQM